MSKAGRQNPAFAILYIRILSKKECDSVGGIHVSRVRDVVCSLALEAAFELPQDMVCALEEGRKKERSPLGVTVFEDLLRNRDIAREERIPPLPGLWYGGTFRGSGGGGSSGGGKS